MLRSPLLGVATRYKIDYEDNLQTLKRLLRRLEAQDADMATLDGQFRNTAARTAFVTQAKHGIAVYEKVLKLLEPDEAHHDEVGRLDHFNVVRRAQQILCEGNIDRVEMCEKWIKDNMTQWPWKGINFDTVEASKEACLDILSNASIALKDAVQNPERMKDVTAAKLSLGVASNLIRHFQQCISSAPSVPESARSHCDAMKQNVSDVNRTVACGNTWATISAVTQWLIGFCGVSHATYINSSDVPAQEFVAIVLPGFLLVLAAVSLAAASKRKEIASTCAKNQENFEKNLQLYAKFEVATLLQTVKDGVVSDSEKSLAGVDVDEFNKAKCPAEFPPEHGHRSRCGCCEQKSKSKQR